MSETLDFRAPDGLVEHARELEQLWPEMLVDLRASGVPLNEGGDPVADVGDPDPGLDPESGEPRADGEPAPDPAPEPTLTPQAPEINWNDIDTLRAAAEHLQGLGYTIGQAPEPVAPEAPTFVDEYGNFDNAALQAYIAQQAQERTAPIEQFIRQLQQAEDERHISGTVSSVLADAGLQLDEAGTRAIRGIAYQLGLNAGVNDPRQATKLATDWLAGERKAAADAAVRAYQESIGQVAATPGEPSAAGGGLRMEPKPSTYDEIIAKYEGRVATV